MIGIFLVFLSLSVWGNNREATQVMSWLAYGGLACTFASGALGISFTKIMMDHTQNGEAIDAFRSDGILPYELLYAAVACLGVGILCILGSFLATSCKRW